MSSLEDRGNQLLQEVWAAIQRASQESELAKIAANPEAHRLTKIMANGAHTGYRYHDAGQRLLGKTKMEKTRFCRAVHKNAAGVYLMWRQVDRYKRMRGRWVWQEAERYDFQWSPTKAEASDLIRKKAERHQQSNAN